MSTFRRNALSLTGLQVANVLLPLATLPYLFRILGPEQFGVYSLSQAVLLQAVILCDFGFNLSATQRVAQAHGDADKVSAIFWAVQAAKMLLALLACMVVMILALTVPTFREIWPVLLAGSPVIFGAVLFPQWLFQGLERMTAIAVCSVLARIAVLPLVFVLVRERQDAWIAALLAGTGPVLAGLMASIIIWRGQLVRWKRPRRADVRIAFVDGWPLFLSTAAISLYTTVTPVLLGVLTHPAAVGLFSAADRLRQGVQGLLTPISNAAFPRISAAMSRDQAAGLTLVRRLLWLQGGLTLTASVLLWLLAPPIVRLVMGPDFDGAVVVLRLLAPVLFVVGLSNVFGIQTMLPLGLKTPFSRIVVASGLINIGLLALLTPRFEAAGAAASILATETVVTLAMAIVLQRLKPGIFRPHSFSKAT